MKEKITLRSRYSEDENYLNRIGDNNSKVYSLQTKFGFRVGIIDDNPNAYSFVDPSGGPFIQKGTEIDGMIVKSIIGEGNNGVIIEFE